ncbi:hypothetical protein [Streptomyces phaeoluteigriseus]
MRTEEGLAAEEGLAGKEGLAGEKGLAAEGAEEGRRGGGREERGGIQGVDKVLTHEKPDG